MTHAPHFQAGDQELCQLISSQYLLNNSYTPGVHSIHRLQGAVEATYDAPLLVHGQLEPLATLAR